MTQENQQASTTATLPRATSTAREPGKGDGPRPVQLRVLTCSRCRTFEVVPWCGQTMDCGHPRCVRALEERAAPHRLKGTRFHGAMSFILIEPHLWEQYGPGLAQAS